MPLLFIPARLLLRLALVVDPSVWFRYPRRRLPCPSRSLPRFSLLLLLSCSSCLCLPSPNPLLPRLSSETTAPGPRKWLPGPCYPIDSPIIGLMGIGDPVPWTLNAESLGSMFPTCLPKYLLGFESAWLDQLQGDRTVILRCCCVNEVRVGLGFTPGRLAN